MMQIALKSLSYLPAFQADDEGLIPFTRSNLRACGASVGEPPLTVIGAEPGQNRPLPPLHYRPV